MAEAVAQWSGVLRPLQTLLTHCLCALSLKGSQERSELTSENSTGISHLVAPPLLAGSHVPSKKAHMGRGTRRKLKSDVQYKWRLSAAPRSWGTPAVNSGGCASTQGFSHVSWSGAGGQPEAALAILSAHGLSAGCALQEHRMAHRPTVGSTPKAIHATCWQTKLWEATGEAPCLC